MTAPGKQRYVLLDGMRGLAALGVILDHVPSGPLGDFFPCRYLGVQFFFVLSGFVMAHAYGERLASGMSPLGLLRVRFIRLYPLYLLGFAIAAITGLTGWAHYKPHELATWIPLGALMLPVPPPRSDALYPLNGPSWSLFFELVVNLVYGLIAGRLTKGVMTGLLAVSGVVYIWSNFAHASMSGPWQWDRFDMGLSGVIYDFFIGVLIYRISLTGKLPRPPAWLAVVLYLAIIAFPLDGVWQRVWDSLAAIVLMPLLVAMFANSQARGALSKVCAGAGALSYGIYVLHVPLAGVLTALIDKLNLPPLEGVGCYLLVAVTATLAAYVAQRVYDKPARRLLAWVLSRQQWPIVRERRA